MAREGDDAERRREAIRLKEARRSAGHGIFELELETGNAWWSDEIFWLLGLDASSFEQGELSLLDGAIPEDRERLRAKLAALRPGEPIAFRFRSRWPDGSEHWLEAVGRVLPADDVGPARAVGRLALVDDQVARERELEAAQAEAAAARERLQRILDALPVGVAVSQDRAASVVSSNRLMTEIFEVPAGADPSLTGPDASRLPYHFRSGGEIVPPDQLPLQRTSREGLGLPNVELEMVFSDGRTKTIVGSTAPLFDDAGHPAGAVSGWIDISDRKRLERDLADARDDLETLIESLPVAVQVTRDVRAETMQMNRAFAELFRLPRTADPSLSGPRAHELSFRFVQAGRALAPSELLVERAARNGERFENVEMELTFSDGERRWILGSAAPLLAPDGTPRGAVACWVDITGRKKLEDELRDALSAKDVFLGLVSHELKTPLTTVLGLSQILASRIDTLDASTRDEAVHALAVDAIRLQQIIENMLTLARGSVAPPELEPILVHHLLNRVMAGRARLFADRTVEVSAAPTPAVLGLPTWVEQIVENFLSNALKYSPAGSPIRVSCEASGAEVRLAVGDRGPGVDPRDLETILLPFVRSASAATKPGVGLGLAVCSQLAANMGGRIEVANRDGGGFEATLVLPVMTE